MLFIDSLFFISGSIAGFLSGIYLFYQAIKNRRERPLLFLLAGVELWSGICYVLVLFGVLPVIGYGPWIRPVTFLQFLAPAFVWAITHSGKGKKKYGYRQ